jgi:adenylate cyclase
MQFDTKIAVVIRTDLEVWQKLNVASFLTSGIAAAFPAAELLAMAMLYRPAGFAAEPPPELAVELIRSVMFLVGGILAGAVGVQLRRQFEASIGAATARDRITNLFGQHVSPEVVERLLLEGGDAASDIRRVAVMFVDFRSFTAGARERTPQEVVDRLDGAFAILVDILDRHGGIVNKFLGDGFLALFGAPIAAADAAQHAVAAAREMLAANDRVNSATSWPLRIGIGIHLGEVVAGNIGSPRRKEYTVIGDTVNFASRLESLNKDFNSQLLISSAVCEALGEAGRDAKSLGQVAIKGYDQPMAVWQLG